MKKIIQHLRKKWYMYILEILVVIIGIMIAYGLNNWRANHLTKELEQQNYQDIKQELEEDLNEIVGNREYNLRYMKRYQKASDIILSDPKMERAEEVGVIAIDLTFYSDFKKEISVFDALRSSGKMELTTNKEILKELQKLGSLYQYINTLENTQREAVQRIFIMVSAVVRFRPYELMDPEQLYDFKFQNLFSAFYSIGEEKEGLYIEAEKRIKLLLEHLQSELEEA